MTVAYVILHYLAGKDTIECAQSILNATKGSSHTTHIVIVDNGSSNDSYADVAKALGDLPQVTLLQSRKNLGFAQGNNIGFAHAKNCLHADFIVMLNNDTLISQENFNEVLVNKFSETGYGILGPDIVTADGFHQNPGTKQRWTAGQLFVFRMKRRILNLLSYMHLDRFIPDKHNSIYARERLQDDRRNTILHGACWIFSPAFIGCRDGLCPDTFLYFEEDILKLQADHYGILMLYSGELSLYHKEDAATNMISGTTAAKLRRKNRHLIHSSLVYSRLLRKYRFCRMLEKTVRKIKRSESFSLDPEMPVSYLLSTILHRSFMVIRGIFRRIGIKKCGKILFVGKNVSLRCKSKMRIGSGVTLADNVCLDALSTGGLSIGNGSSIGSGTIIRCSGNMKTLGRGFTMGHRSSLADNCFVGATGGVWIGDDVIGGQNIRFHSSNHNFADTSSPIRTQGITAKGIRIGNDCWIGAGVVFCDGITLGDGCVVGANAVVTKSFPSGSVIAGVPAKQIDNRTLH